MLDKRAKNFKGGKLIMNEAEKKAFEMLSKKEQEEVIGGSNLTAEQCKALRSKVSAIDIPGPLLIKYGGPMPPHLPEIDPDKIIRKKPDKPTAD